MHVEHFGPDKPFQVNTIDEENIRVAQMTNNFIIIRYAIKMLRIFLLRAFFSSLY